MSLVYRIGISGVQKVNPLPYQLFSRKRASSDYSILQQERARVLIKEKTKIFFLFFCVVDGKSHLHSRG